ncbi:MAG: hypothetical protein QNK37_37070 [Acidobacteriota bacterium]|nr:hypothetical protein [Acidobacteriota bacterium]
MRRHALNTMCLLIMFTTAVFLQKDEHTFTQDFRIEDRTFAHRLDAFTPGNPYFLLEPGWWVALEGQEADDEGELETIRMEITVLDETQMVNGVLTRVVEEREWVDGELAEVSRNFHAICLTTGDVFYFGEEVEDYEDGVLVGSEGEWLAGEDGAMPGIIMPGSILIGARYMQEIAPEDDAMDRGEIIDIIDVTLAGQEFEDVVVIRDTSALEPEDEGDIKYFAPGIGQIKDAELELVDFGWKFRTPGRWMAHVTRFDGGFETELRFMNGGDADADMTLTPYLADGQMLDAVGLTVPAGTTHSVDARDLFGESEVSHFAIDGPANCVVYGVYKAQSGVSSVAEVRESGLPVYGISFFEGEYEDTFFDGLALVNHGSEAAAVSARQIAPDGSVLDEETIQEDLAPNAKALISFSDVFDNQPGSVIEVSADQPFNATLLRGTEGEAPAVMLWTIMPLAVRSTPVGSEPGGGTMSLEEGKLLIEHNATDEDTGFQGFADGDPWKELEIIGPGGEVMSIEADGNLEGFGLAELFFETNEPENAEVPIADVLARLPEGEYTFKATMVDDSESTVTTTFSHTIPAGPVLIAPEDGAENVDPANTVISWNPVTQTIDGSPDLTIAGYQVIVEVEEQPPFPQTFVESTFSAYVPADVTSITVPAAFMQAGKAYEYEVLAIEASGNQTISAAEFFTGPEFEVEDPEEPPIKDAKLLIEHNGTDEDTGFQGFGDGDPWNSLEVEGPEGKILEVSAEGMLQDFGLTELFFETSEPKNSVVPIADVLALLPEGEYTYKGEIAEGGEGELAATFTHRIPAVPELLTPQEEAEVDPANLVISWNPVTQTLDGSTDIEIVGYQVIVELDEDQQFPQGFAHPVLSVYVPASVTSIQIPAEFLKADADYEFEVLAVEASGNQTIAESEFETIE